jgi:glycosyltransferase involved in cell wall biosynthesis
MDQASLVSVIIPVRNGVRHLAEAVESVRAQRYHPLEILVVDDASTDGTGQLARQWPDVRYIARATRCGAGAARNLGVARSRGELLAFLDADDIRVRDKLVIQTAVLAGDSTLDAVFGHVVPFWEGGEGEGEAMPGPVPGTILIRREAFDRVGGFDEDPGSKETVDWYLRATEGGLRMRMLPEVVYRRRIHGDNRGIRERDMGGYLVALKASLDRRRCKGSVGP